MKIKKLLEIQSKFEEAVIPRDMNNIDLNKHYSESEDKEIDILDMDLIHLIRSYSKCIGNNNIIVNSQSEKIRAKLDGILMETYSTRDLLDK
tara:strand:- start:567 stop:842 length:276 start_codon:yes stop_codon:yes gene_type:complete